MGTLRNHCLTQGRRMPIATHEPFIAKQRSTVGCIAHDLLPALLRKHSVLRYYHEWGPWSLLYTRPIQGFWRFLLHALSLSRLPCCCTTSSIAQPALRTPYYQTEGLSSVRHTVELCESTMLLCHLRACCTEAPIMVSVGDTTAR